VPLPETSAIPTSCQPEHDAGAAAAGPKTQTVISPWGENPPDSAADTEDAEIALPDVPDAGALTDSDGCAVATVVLVMPAPQVELASGLFAPPS
jgi:hypothetical protein